MLLFRKICFLCAVLLVGEFISCNVDTSDDEKKSTDTQSTMYAVAFQSERGTVPQPFTVKENSVLSTSQLPELSASGFRFDGWYDGNTLAQAGVYKVTKNVTLVAKWSELKCTITYISEHGTVPKQISVEKNTILTSAFLPEISTDDGYIFDGWYIPDNYGAISQKAVAGNYIVRENITLVAKWKKFTSVTVTLPEDNTEISLSLTQNDRVWTLTAGTGFSNYVWRIEGEKQAATGNILSIDTSNWIQGYYEASVEAEENGEYYSARAYITVGGN